MNLSNPKKRETWLYTIEEPLQYNSAIIGKVGITFFEGKFEKAEYPFEGVYTADQWGLLGQISAKIKEIEKMYEEIGKAL